MEATTPTGSRRIIEVLGRRHPRQAASGAGEEAEDVDDGRISSLITQCSGLPQFSDSSCAGGFSLRRDGVRQLQEAFRTRLRRRRLRASNARSANGGIDAAVASAISGITSPVAGLYTGTFSPSPATKLPFINRLCCIALSCFMVLFPVSGVAIAVAGEPPAPKIGIVVTSITNSATTLVTGTSRGRPS